MNLRNYTNHFGSYFTINREERNLAAIFYHVLLLKNNLKIFVEYIGCDHKLVDDEVEIYFEYAFIRDLWHNIDKTNEKVKRTFILEQLQLNNSVKLEQIAIKDFNYYFGAVRIKNNERISSVKEIESPGNWSILYMDKIPDADFLKVCKFKWSFNAKPDIVINTSKGKTICIEAKLLSGEGHYPSNTLEKEIFKRRLPSEMYVSQTEIQQQVMSMLGFDSYFITLVKDERTKFATKQKSFLWKEVFRQLDTQDCPVFIKQWITLL